MSVQSAVRRRPLEFYEGTFAHDVIEGLTARPKRLAPKYFYDEEGSRLFDEITRLPEYYPTRCELSILAAHATDIARLLPIETALIEFGSGSTRKARLLLDAAPAIAAYVPVDISANWLSAEAAQLSADYPRLKVLPIAADFTQSFRLPPSLSSLARTGFFPGSTIGNFEAHQACAFLQHAARILGPEALLIVGVDLVKEPSILNAAYDDAAGVTAKFNLNILARINRELGADFDLTRFCHQAFYNRERSRIEMHLASLVRQRVHVCGRNIDFRAGETIHTENSYKYTVDSFGALARGCGWAPVAVWTDADNYFSVQALRAIK
ncbi:MAG TPA: L-histidine N(alpha)-methyltransferase [Xanthobacteraceae bacterium]|nr:L-histidine N(alpha)-methyltransferase [Xanthobacteraceae bacterium]